MWWFIGAFIVQAIFNVWILWKFKQLCLDVAKELVMQEETIHKCMDLPETNTDTLEKHQNVLFDMQRRLGRTDDGDLFDAWEPWQE